MNSTQCPLCEVPLTDTAALHSHLALTHLELYRHRCEECDFKCLEKAEILRHIDTTDHQCTVNAVGVSLTTIS